MKLAEHITEKVGVSAPPFLKKNMHKSTWKSFPNNSQALRIHNPMTWGWDLHHQSYSIRRGLERVNKMFKKNTWKQPPSKNSTYHLMFPNPFLGWYCWWFRNPANSPVEVGSLSQYLQGLGYIQTVVVLDFFQQRYFWVKSGISCILIFPKKLWKPVHHSSFGSQNITLTSLASLQIRYLGSNRVFQKKMQHWYIFFIVSILYSLQ